MSDAATAEQPNQAGIQSAIEASLIGSVMRNRGLLSDLGEVGPDHFVDAAYRDAWRRVVDDSGIDDETALHIAVPTLTPVQLRQVAQSFGHKRATVLRARDRIVENRARKELRRIYQDGLAALDAESSPAAEIADRTSRSLGTMSLSASLSSSASEVAMALLDLEMSEAIPTGIRALDYVTYGGLWIGQVLGIFARFKVGKTVMMATLARNLEKQAVPTLMVSLERRKHDVEKFIVARSLGIDARDLDLRGNPEHKAAFEEYIQDRRCLRYIHRPGITIDELRSIIIAEVLAHGIKVVLVDYWQLITNPGSKSNQQEKQQEAAQMLADLAATLDIPIVVTGQLNQEGDPRGGEGILASAGLVVRINRPDEMETGFLEGMVSNKGPIRTIGNPQKPSIALIQPGPHFDDYHDDGS